eukprot:scaffold108005_cov37-Tisochrysis_lutea.AAC.1
MHGVIPLAPGGASWTDAGAKSCLPKSTCCTVAGHSNQTTWRAPSRLVPRTKKSRPSSWDGKHVFWVEVSQRACCLSWELGCDWQRVTRKARCGVTYLHQEWLFFCVGTIDDEFELGHSNCAPTWCGKVPFLGLHGGRRKRIATRTAQNHSASGCHRCDVPVVVRVEEVRLEGAATSVLACAQIMRSLSNVRLRLTSLPLSIEEV